MSQLIQNVHILSAKVSD